ncbi:MAG: hypothetical protein HC799_02285 [Limnothrix sp. RL_2_0]|nr:hypothetical protein [Limnothrix sp. RL_2_0]
MEIIVFLIFFVSLWWLVLFLLTKLSGWDKLAERYGDRQPFQGQIFHFCSAYIGPVRYKSAIDIGISEAGIHLNPFIIFRLSYPPVLIPWHQISDFEEKSFWLMKYYVFNVGDSIITTIKVPSRVFTVHPEILAQLLKQP